MKNRPIGLEDMIWAIKMLMMTDKEIERMIKNFRDAVLEFNKRLIDFKKGEID